MSGQNLPKMSVSDDDVEIIGHTSPVNSVVGKLVAVQLKSEASPQPAISLPQVPDALTQIASPTIDSAPTLLQRKRRRQTGGSPGTTSTRLPTEEEEDDDDDDVTYSSEERLPKSKAKKKQPRKKRRKPAPKPEHPVPKLKCDPFWDVLEKDDKLLEYVKDSPLLNDRRVFRIVKNREVKELRMFIEDFEHNCTVGRPRSLSVSHHALSHAVESGNRELIELFFDELGMRQIAAKENRHRKPNPNQNISKISAGSVSRQAYGCRVASVNLSRGNKEGDQAFIKDSQLYRAQSPIEVGDTWKSLLLHSILNNVDVEHLKMAYDFAIRSDLSIEHDMYDMIGQALNFGRRKVAIWLMEMALKQSAGGLNTTHLEALAVNDVESVEDCAVKWAEVRRISLTKKMSVTKASPFHSASLNPNVNVLKYFVEQLGQFAILQVVDEYGRSVGHYAAAGESLQPLKYLIEDCQMQVDVTDLKSVTPLMCAALAGRAANVEYLLRKGADVNGLSGNSQGKKFRSPPNDFITNGSLDLLGLSTLHYAIHGGDLECLDVLLKASAVIVDRVDARSKSTPLHRAAALGRLDLVERLLQSGAVVDSLDKFKRTPATLAVINGNTKIAQVLLEKGARVSALDTSGNSLLHYACAYGWLHCVKLLLGSGGNLNAANSWKTTPLFLAHQKSHYGVVRWLVERTDIDVNATNCEGSTLLSLACAQMTESNLRLIELLLSKNANPNVLDKDGRNSLHVLVSRSDIESKTSRWNRDPEIEAAARRESEEKARIEAKSVDLLVAHKVELNKTDDAGRSPLSTAFLAQNFGCLDRLLEHGVDPTTRSPEGDNVLHFLCQRAVDQVSLDEKGNVTKCCLSALSALTRTVGKETLKKLASETNNTGLTPLIVLARELGKFVRIVGKGEMLYMTKRRQVELFLVHLLSNVEMDPLQVVGPTKRISERGKEQLKASRNLPVCGGSSSSDDSDEDEDEDEGEVEDDVEGSENQGTDSEVESGDAAEAEANANGSDETMEEEADSMPSPKVRTEYFRYSHDRDVAGITRVAPTCLEECIMPQFATSDRKKYQFNIGKQCPLHFLMAGKDATWVETFVSQMLVMGVTSPPTERLHDMHGVTPLHVGVSRSVAESVISCLLKWCPELIDLRKFDGVTALMMSVALSNFVLSDLLLRHKANVEICDLDNRSPLLVGCCVQSEQCVDALVTCGAKVEQVDNNKRTGLHWAVSQSSHLTFTLQRKFVGGHVNSPDVDGRTPLHCCFAKVGRNLRNCRVRLSPDEVSWTFSGNRPFLSTVSGRLGGLGVASGARLIAINEIPVPELPVGVRQLWKDETLIRMKVVDDGEVEDLLVDKKKIPKNNLDITLQLPVKNLGNYDPVESVGSLCSLSSLEVDPKDRDGRTPLHLAAMVGATVSALNLIKRGANINSVDNDGNSVLSLALLCGHSSFATTLLTQKADVNMMVMCDNKPHRRTLYLESINLKSFGLAHMLILEGFPLYLALRDAIQSKQILVAAAVLDKISDSNSIEGPGDDPEGRLLTHHVASSTSCHAAVTLLKNLMKKGVPVCVQTKEGLLPHHCAASSGNLAIFDELVKAHPKGVNVTDSNGWLPVHHAFLKLINCRNFESISVLMISLRHCPSLPETLSSTIQVPKLPRPEPIRCATKSEPGGTEISVESTESRSTLLIECLRLGQIERVELLLNSMVDVNVPDCYGRTPLMWAAKMNNKTIAMKLMSLNADVAAKDQRNWTILHHLVQPRGFGSFENEEFFSLFKNHKAVDVNAIDSSGRSAAGLAAHQSSGTCLKALKNLGANVSRTCQIISEWDNAIAWDSSESVDYMADSEKLLARIRAMSIDIESKPPLAHRSYGMPGKNVVLIDEGDLFDALLVKVDLSKGEWGENNFYHLQLIHETVKDLFGILSRWGRIGESGSLQRTPMQDRPAAMKEFKKIFKSKTGNDWDDRENFTKKPKKYSLLQIESVQIRKDKSILKGFDFSRSPDCQLPPALGHTMRRICDPKFIASRLKFLKVDETRLPLQHLNRGTLAKAAAILNDIGSQIRSISQLVADRSDVKYLVEAKMNLLELSSKYYELLPTQDHVESAVPPIKTEEALTKEKRRLCDLQDVHVAARILLGAQRRQWNINPYDYCYRSLPVNFVEVNMHSEEFQLILNYLHNTSDAQPQLTRLWQVARRDERERFKRWLKVPNRRLLWHGSGTCNILGILARGLCIAPTGSMISGAAYGEGIYFADMASKSLGYTRALSTSAPQYLMLFDVALGKSMTVNVDGSPPTACASLVAYGQRAPDWDNEAVRLLDGVKVPVGKPITTDTSMSFAEFIIFEESRCKMRYLLELNDPFIGD